MTYVGIVMPISSPDSTEYVGGLLEIYVSVVLSTPYNDFDTH
jgi:hypothetical protein